MRAIIISGGNIEDDFALDFLRKNAYDYLAAADRGVEFCCRNGLVPDIAVGDFDSANPGMVLRMEKLGATVRRLVPEKDDSDTEAAFSLAADAGADEVAILGGSGNRLDHVWANIQLLARGRLKGISACLVDAHNFITVRTESFSIRRDAQFGKYISFYSMGDVVSGLTLKGFRYPLTDFCLTNTAAGRTVSNEIAAAEAEVLFASGMLLVIQSRD